MREGSPETTVAQRMVDVVVASEEPRLLPAPVVSLPEEGCLLTHRIERRVWILEKRGTVKVDHGICRIWASSRVAGA